MKKKYQYYNYNLPKRWIEDTKQPDGETIVTVEKFTIECIDEIDTKVNINSNIESSCLLLSQIDKRMANEWYRIFLNFRRNGSGKDWTTFLKENFNVINDGKSHGLGVFTVCY